MLPIASDIATRSVRDVANSALPDAPIEPDPAPRQRHLRTRAAVALHALAQRLDPCSIPAPARLTASRAG